MRADGSQELDYTRDDVVVDYRWIPRRHATGGTVPERELWRAATELEFRTFREHGRRVNWGRDRLLDGVFYDFPDAQTLPARERQTALGLLPQQQPWPWLRSRMRLMRSWVTTRPDQPVDLFAALDRVNDQIKEEQAAYFVRRLRQLFEEIERRESDPDRVQAGLYGFYMHDGLDDEHAGNTTLCDLLRVVRERGPAVGVVTDRTTRMADEAWERARQSGGGVGRSTGRRHMLRAIGKARRS
ncbi:hypothetical protein [Streptomyces sp. NPDC058247]|uniref:hypothetical protein n=1 Tax=Streptomyces sp. NPDC058247 TaxID=3346401 RepID=UPI0036E89554